MFIRIGRDGDALALHFDVVVRPVRLELVESDDNETDDGEDNIDVVDAVEADLVLEFEHEAKLNEVSNTEREPVDAIDL